MDSVSKSKWQIRAAALAIFLLGGVAGALTLNAYQARRAASGPRSDRFEQMLERLQLTAAQETQVKQVLDEMRGQLQTVRRESAPKVAEIRRQADERLQQVLTPQQWEQFQHLRSELWGRRRRGGTGYRSPEERR